MPSAALLLADREVTTRTTTRRLRRAIGPALMAGLLLAPAPLLAERGIVERFAVSPGGLLQLTAQGARVEVSGGSASTVEVRIRRGNESAGDILDDWDVEIEGSGDDVRVRIERAGALPWLHFGWGRDLEVEVEVPQRYDLDLETSGGSIDVVDLHGEIRAKTSGGTLSFDRIEGEVWGRTSGGSVRVESTVGPVDVETSGGRIRIGEVEGSVRAHTSGGSIEIERALGEVDAHTSGGSIDIRDAGGPVIASTSGGGVRAFLSRQPSADSRLETSGGQVIVYLAEDIAVDLDARTSGGRVTTDLPVEIRGQISRSEIAGQVNGGGPALVLRSSGGGIRLAQR